MTQYLAIAGSLLFACAAGLVAWTLVSVMTRAGHREPNRVFEPERRQALRKGSATYRLFEPLVDELASWNLALRDARSLDNVKRWSIQADEELPWRPEEHFALLQLEGLLVALVIGGGLSWLSLPLGIIVGLALLLFYPMFEGRRLQERAARRQQQLKRRLPFSLDLMALMLEASGTFADALRAVVKENRRHPLGQELKRVMDMIEMGRPQSEALRAFQSRVDDQDVVEMVTAINTGEELGTPLRVVLRNQAEQMRLKRSQWGEKAAAEAQVRMVFPGLLVMLACMLVILAPLGLAAIFQRPG